MIGFFTIQTLTNRKTNTNRPRGYSITRLEQYTRRIRDMLTYSEGVDGGGNMFMYDIYPFMKYQHTFVSFLTLNCKIIE